MSTSKIPTIAQRWDKTAEASGLVTTLPPHVLQLARVMFYAGFSAALDAETEVAEMSDLDAMLTFSALHVEISQFAAKAESITASGAAPFTSH